MIKATLTSALALSIGSLAQLGYACSPSPDVQLSKLDVAFADVIFEGSVKEVNKNQIVFDVGHVLRGELPDKTITVSLALGFAYGPPKSVDDFISKYGDYTRVALTTPEQVKTFCQDRKPVANARHFSRPCDYDLIGLQLYDALEMPYILKNNCGPPYLFSVEKYEKSKNYEKNVKIFEQKITDIEGREFKVSHRDLYKNIVGNVGPLPWNRNYGQNFENTAVELYQKDPNILNLDFTSATALDRLYVLQGKNPIQRNTPREKQKWSDEDRIIHYLKQMKVIMEKDPNFAERLKEEN